MKTLLLWLTRWLCLLVFLCGGIYFTLHGVHHSTWYKERLYRQLLAGNRQEQLRAASALALVGGQKQLLAAIKSETPPVRELARRSLEYLWFNEAGEEAYQMTQAAHKAAEKENFQDALAILNRLIEKYPKYAEGWNRRASVYWQMGNYEKSITDCEQALVLNPNHYGAWQGLGVCRLHVGDIAAACRSLRAALRIAPYDEAARDSLQRCEKLLRPYPYPAETEKIIDLI